MGIPQDVQNTVSAESGLASGFFSSVFDCSSGLSSGAELNVSVAAGCSGLTAVSCTEEPTLEPQLLQKAEPTGIAAPQ